jgi:hypothetical protein
MGPRIQNSKEVLDGDKEKGCQEEEEKVTLAELSLRD